MKLRLGALASLVLLAACGIKGAPKPSRKPAPKASPPAAVTQIPTREATSGGVVQDGGAAPPTMPQPGSSAPDGGPAAALPAGGSAMVAPGADAGR